MRLSELQTGDSAYIVKVNGSGAFRKRILEMGFVRGQEVKSILNAPLKDPIKYGIMDYEVSLRRSEAVLIEISKIKEETERQDNSKEDEQKIEKQRSSVATKKSSTKSKIDPKTIRVALIGNPNAGKTSIFNHASGAHEHVGNYGGVTIDAKEATIKHGGYIFKLIDLPGTYSLSAYSPEELFVRRFVLEEKPDVVINVVAASALERNLYLTTELIELKHPMVIALNMYDELEKSGRQFDHETMSSMLNIPMVPTVGKKGDGIPELLESVIEIHEGKQDLHNINIPYGRVLEKSIEVMERELCPLQQEIEKLNMPIRYTCIKYLEGDKDVERIVSQFRRSKRILARRNKEHEYITRLLKEDPESAFVNARYGFIAGALKETFEDKKSRHEATEHLDAVLTNKYFGLPFFFLFLWIMFEATFRLGEYPMEWIEASVQYLGNLIRGVMTDGPFKDLLVDGVINGVGGVIVFLPNIVILYAFISFMEDSGYMARAAFIMDKLMQNIGLHGKSFIPLIMGFGCNVPAIMSTRMIESRNSRMITMLIIPFMSCSARLPVYILFVSAFFAKHGSFIMLGLYIIGIIIAILTALLLRKYFFTDEDTPFVMELPPYRMPTFRSVIIHMWEKSKLYLLKMGGPILMASIIIWILGYFPENRERAAQFDQQIAQIEQSAAMSEEVKKEKIQEVAYLKHNEHQENSYIGKVGRFIEPVMRPLGFDWKISISLLSGMTAKEIVISTMGVLYTGDSDDQQSLKTRLKAEKHPNGEPVFTPLVAFGFLLFILIYFPCIATIVAIKEESHSWKWALFSVFYTTGVAWLVSFAVYQIGSLFI